MTIAESVERIEKGIALLLILPQHVEVVDHSAGRIKLKFTMKGAAEMLGKMQGLDINQLVQHLPGLEEYNVSVLRRTIDIRYDPTRIPEDLWNELFSITGKPDVIKAMEDRLRLLFGDDTTRSSERTDKV